MAQRHHAQRLGDAGHGGGGAHHAAGAGGGGQPALDLADPLGGDAAGAVRRPVAAAVGAGGQPLALVRRRQHRPGDKLHRRDVGRGGGHQLRRHRLVAAADQHRGIHRLRGQHRLGVERGEVAVVHRGREQRRLAQRHGGERQRQPAGGQHAALHRLDQFGDGAMAVVEARAGIDDAHHRPVQHRLRVAHRFGERPAQIEREVAVAVVGGVAGQAAFRCGFFVHAEDARPATRAGNFDRGDDIAVNAKRLVYFEASWIRSPTRVSSVSRVPVGETAREIATADEPRIKSGAGCR